MTIAIKRSARKTLQLTVTPQGQIIIRAPRTLALSRIQTFIKQKKSWIQQAIQKQRARISLPHDPSNYAKYKETAQRLIQERLGHFNQVYAFEWNKINIRNSSSRWGSCSRRRNLNFNYRLIYLPAEIQDYIMVHELCHLQEMNHGKKFWRLVALTLPHHTALRKKLCHYRLT